MNRFYARFVVAALLLFPCGAYAQAIPETAAKNAIVIDYDTGTVLFEKNADERVPTASMSKVLTTIVVYDAIKAGTLKMDTMLPVSEKAWRESDPDVGGSTMFLDINSSVKVEDLLRGVVIQSGNDACIVLAEGIAGSEANFAELLNEKAAEIGMTNSHFANATGLDDPNHYSTSRDLALMGAYLIHHYPEDYKLYAQKEFVYNNIRQGNRNPLLYKDIGADGVKTGHTSVAGFGLIGSAATGDRRVVVVINGTKSMQERSDEAVKLMQWGQTSFKNMTLLKKGQVIDKVPVVLGAARDVNIVAADSMISTVPAFTKTPAQITASYKVPLVAPVRAGDKVGSLLVTLTNGQTSEIPLLSESDVAEASFFARISEKLMIMLVGVPKY
ncbi:MAG: D-alanyl-D-alanine carboxypeptidase family protein [Pseudobdellovibrionaceae bacterium]